VAILASRRAAARWFCCGLLAQPFDLRALRLHRLGYVLDKPALKPLRIKGRLDLLVPLIGLRRSIVIATALCARKSVFGLPVRGLEG
jgi:hypothetical protein